ncbi:hypothetical protein V6N12_025033 [Hibiscus sabdariffa]|uniref:PB1-like domain-containing protein n=1 Tax=Hibiscus sabdariffa TaxID=183260 RepID=A0ABR2BLA2_9ROSI
MSGRLREKGEGNPKYGVHSEKFSTVIHHGGFIVRRPRFKFTGKLVDYFDNLDVDRMSMFEIVAMVEKLGITYNVKVFWQLTDKPIEVKQLKNDGDVIKMVSNLPRDHYVHLYLEEVVGFSETKMDEPGLGEAEIDEPDLGEAEMNEPDIGEPEMDEHEMDEPELGELEMDEHVMDEPELGEPGMDEHESEVRLEFESDSKDEEYVAGSESSSAVSSFSDRENEIVSSEDEVDEESNVNVGLGNDEVDVQIRGEKQWTVEETMEPILPPLFRRPTGRPYKKRKREIDEPTPQPGKASRRGVKIFYKKCGGIGHNIKTCKGRVGGNIRGPGQTSTSSARAPKISKLPTRRPTTTPTSHGENSPRPTPTSHGGNSPRPTLLPTQPSEVHTTRWMPTPTTTNHVGTPLTTAHGGTSPRPTPLPTQPSQGHTARWMPTPTTTTTHVGTPPTSAHGGTSPRPTPLPTQPSQGHTVRWMPTPTATTHLSQESSTNQPSPKVDP